MTFATARRRGRDGGETEGARKEPNADRAARVSPGLSPAPLSLQRSPDPDAPTPPAAGAPSPPTPAAAVPGALLVDDTAQPLPGQMRRSEFLASLRGAVCATAQEALSSTPWSAAGCPWVDYWFGYYAGRDAAQVERALRGYAPDAAAVTTAAAAIPVVCSRVRGSIATWASTGEVPGGLPAQADGAGAPAGDGTPAAAGETPAGSDAGAVQRKEIAPGSGGQVSPAAVRARLSGGSHLPSRVRGRMESAFGQDFSPVRLHSGREASSIASHIGARAFTVGTDIGFASGALQPDTLAGDALLAHELAHVVQQRGGAPGAERGGTHEGALEDEADRAAAGALAGAFGAPGQVPLMARGGLRLQRCSSCGDQPRRSQFEVLNSSDSPAALADQLSGSDVTDAQLTDYAQRGGPLLAEAVSWERAMRRRDFAALARLSQSSTRPFPQAYASRLVQLIMAGGTCMHIVDDGQGFAGNVSSTLTDLASGGPTGFRVVVSVLAAGQTVTISNTTGETTTERVMTGPNPDAGVDLSAGRMVTTGPDGSPLPVAQQHPGTPTGSTIALNTDPNMVTLGGTARHLEVIGIDQSLTLGHELIHALHNARGENIAPPPFARLTQLGSGRPNYEVGNPATNDHESAEEMRTITGATSFTAPPTFTPATVNWPLSYNLADDGLNENALRRERGLPERVSHRGAHGAAGRNMPAGTTLDAIVGRYTLAGGGAVPPALRSALRDVILQLNPYFNDHPSLPIELLVMFPPGDYMAMHLAFIAGQTDLAETARDLRFQ